MKLYTFLGASDEIICQIRARSHGEAIIAANASGNCVSYDTCFYSETIKDEDQ